MSESSDRINQLIGGNEATLRLVNGDTFRIRGDIEFVSDVFVSLSLSNNPDKKGRMLVNINHIVSIDWYVK